MLLTISTTHKPATDLGYLLHKHPGRLHQAEIAYGSAYCFYPEASEDRCTAALLLDIDSVALTRGRVGDRDTSFALEPYVNDRPFVANSMMSVAIAELFGTAMNGRSKERQALAEQEIPFEVDIPTLPSSEGPEFIRSLFEPLGYAVEIEGIQLDSKFPEWGMSDYYSIKLRGTHRLSSLLRHLYVLIPVLDDYKHYWINEAEVEKILRLGEGWLKTHPLAEKIMHRSLRRIRSLTESALESLMANEGETRLSTRPTRSPEEEFEKKTRLNDTRLAVVAGELENLKVKSVIDLGCGEGKLLKILLTKQALEKITGLEVSIRELERAKVALDLERLPTALRAKIDLIHGSLTYLDDRTKGFEAATLIEVIEHLDPDRLRTLEQNVFGFISAQHLIVTTPNREYNAKFERLGGFRHPDHRFEWTRREFADWCQRVSSEFGYQFRIEQVGEIDSDLGGPTQMGVFSK